MDRQRAIIYAAVFVAGFLLISLWSFSLIVRPLRIEVPTTPLTAQLPFEEVTLTADDGTNLSAWFIPATSTAAEKRAVILLHGYPVEKGDMVDIAKDLHDGFAVLLMDLRYFGASEGSFTTLGLRERDDVRKAVDFLESRGFERIGIFGFSLGGATAILAAERDPRIAAVATYGAFADQHLLGYAAYGHLLILKYPLVALMEVWGRILFGAWLSEASPQEAAKELKIPVFLAHSKEDEQIPFTHAEILLKALSGAQTETYILERGRHGVLPRDFNDRLRAYLDRAI